MSSFTTTDLGAFEGARYAVFTFHEFWHFNDLSWLIQHYGFDHLKTDHLLVAASIIQRLVRDDFLHENSPVGAYGSIVPVGNRDYSHVIPAVRVSKTSIQYLRVPLYQGVSGWGFLVSMPILPSHPCG